MQCARCEQENPPGARFCNSCGAGLELACSSCGHSNPAGSRFCNHCGASLGATPNQAGPRFLRGIVHSQAPRREDPHVPGGPGGRAQVRDGPRLGNLYRRTGNPGQAQEHLTAAAAMYGEMGMTYWLEKLRDGQYRR
jgi:hypothetical protein